MMKVLRVKEPTCMACGRGMVSGYPYPDCARPPEGMTRDEAHHVFCESIALALCDECDARVRQEYRDVP